MQELNYTTGQAIVATETNINERVKYTANTGIALLSTANANLDGTGTVVTLLTPGVSVNGTYIKSITLKGAQALTRGMVRLFLNNTESGTKHFWMSSKYPGSHKQGYRVPLKKPMT